MQVFVVRVVVHIRAVPRSNAAQIDFDFARLNISRLAEV